MKRLNKNENLHIRVDFKSKVEKRKILFRINSLSGLDHPDTIKD